MGSLRLTEIDGRKHVTATNARINLGALMDYIKATGETVIIDRRGKPPVRAIPWTPENLEWAIEEMRKRRERLGQ